MAQIVKVWSGQGHRARLSVKITDLLNQHSEQA